MINANELRIGNLVLVGDKPTIVESVDPQGINSSISHGYYPGETEIEYLAHFQGWPGYVAIGGIPLTEEWLLKFGFEKYPMPYDEESEKDFDYLRLELRPDEQIVWFPKGKEVYVSGRYDPEFYGAQAEVQYVHQLQNLYFTLTGKELEINL